MSTLVKEMIVSVKKDVEELRNHRNFPRNLSNVTYVDADNKSSGYIAWRNSEDAADKILEIFLKKVDDTDY